MAAADGGAALRSWGLAGAQPEGDTDVIGTACWAALTRAREERLPEPGAPSAARCGRASRPDRAPDESIEWAQVTALAASDRSE